MKTKAQIIEEFGGEPHHWHRHKNTNGKLGGWVHKSARICLDVFIGESTVIRGGNFYGGTYFGGTYFGGTFHGGNYFGGNYFDGIYFDGTFHGGTFNGGNFHGGNYHGGNYHGGTFHGGNYHGGTFYDGKWYAQPTIALRSDGYEFIVAKVDNEIRVWAGCRNFSWNEAIEHWSEPHPRSVKTLKIINFLKGLL